MQTTWKIHTKSDGIHYATALTGDWPTVTVGREVSLRFRTVDTPTLVVESGETHTVPAGEVEIYDETIVRDGGTLNENGTLVRTGGENFRPWLEYAGAAARGVNEDMVPYYREGLPGRARVDSHVLGFEPDTELRKAVVPGFWGLLTGGGDRTNPTFTNREVEFLVFVLGRFRDWTRSEIESTMQA